MKKNICEIDRNSLDNWFVKKVVPNNDVGIDYYEDQYHVRFIGIEFENISDLRVQLMNYCDGYDIKKSKLKGIRHCIVLKKLKSYDKEKEMMKKMGISVEEKEDKKLYDTDVSYEK